MDVAVARQRAPAPRQLQPGLFAQPQPVLQAGRAAAELGSGVGAAVPGQRAPLWALAGILALCGGRTNNSLL